ncbi:MAG: sensor histidine kinase [Deltaproteobacteria bacterium]|nr:MAG: sensor histidine kinase [Deltaproteobacteria bacterium]
MATGQLRSISTPILLTVVGVLLCIGLLVGWTLVIADNIELGESLARSNRWLLLAGPLSFFTIMTVLVIFCFRLVRDVLEHQRQSRFIDSVTHELRSPLASLRLCLDTLRRRDLSPEQRAELLEMMADDVNRLSGFIDDILEASRLESGSAGAAMMEVDLRALVDRAADRVLRRYRVDPDSIVNEVPPGLRLFTDETALETVLKNLMDNAVKYSDPPVHVVVRARLEGRRVHVEVEDRGIGIPRAHLKRVFDRFFRVPAVQVHKRQGTGLGLYVVSSLVRELGGRLDARSPGRDQGTTMHFTLPVTRPGNPRSAAPAEGDGAFCGVAGHDPDPATEAHR